MHSVEELVASAVLKAVQAASIEIAKRASTADLRAHPVAWIDVAAEVIDFCVRKGIRVAYIGRRRMLLEVTSEVTEVCGPELRVLRDLYANQPKRPEAIYGDDVDPQLMFLLYLRPGLHRLAAAPGGLDRLRPDLSQVLARDATFARRAWQFLEYWRRPAEGSIGQGEADVI